MGVRYRGHDIQIIRYDYDDEAVAVMVDGDDARQMPLRDVGAYIERQTR